MLKNNLYRIENFANNGGRVEASIFIDAGHEIFKGHFPGQPVLPGVCMMQIIKEITEEATGNALFMQKADQCKFLTMVDPLKTPAMKIIVDFATIDEKIEANAVLKTDESVFLKMKCNFSNEPA